MFIADRNDIQTFPPFKTTTNEGDKLRLDGQIVLKFGKKWETVDIICETGKITHSAVGSGKSRCYENRLDFKLQKDIGSDEWFNRHINFCGVILIREKTGGFRVFGNDDEGARFEAIDGTTGADLFDEKSWTAKIVDKTGSVAPYYEDIITTYLQRSFSPSFSLSFH